jgi:hypothetical protein
VTHRQAKCHTDGRTDRQTEAGEALELTPALPLLMQRPLSLGPQENHSAEAVSQPQPVFTLHTRQPSRQVKHRRHKSDE